MLRAEQGDVPAAAQQRLKESWRQQGYFLACTCRSTGDLAVARCDATRAFASRVVEVEPLADQRVYLCGSPQFVRSLRKRIYLAGTPLTRIHADPFLQPAKV